MTSCHKCGSPWSAEKRQPGFKDVCETCSAYLHCCRNCRFHDTSAHNQCRIPNTEWVTDRARLNFCEEFEFRHAPETSGEDAERLAARERLQTLFGDTSTAGSAGASGFFTEAELPRKPGSFEELFRG